MDEDREGILLIGTFSIILLAFLLITLAVMLIYRKRKLQHAGEIQKINEKYIQEILKVRLESQQETMKYIGREIHDNVGHQLTLAFLYLQQIELRDQKYTELLHEITEILNESLKDLRSFSKSLIQSETNEEVSLRDLLEKECERLQSIRFCKVELTGDQIDLHSYAQRSMVFRIVQEFINNSIKHAKCEHIKINLEQTDTKIIIKTSDNGVGFNTRNKSTGSGLDNMNKRAIMLGATFELTSDINKGTKMKLEIPYSTSHA